MRALLGNHWMAGAGAGVGVGVDSVSTNADSLLVGRERELQLLFGHLREVESRGRAFGLLGDPGVGKSALLGKVLARAASQGVTVLTARASQAETQFPFAGLHQLLRPLLPFVDQLPVNQRNALLACFAMTDATDTNPFFTSLAVLELVVDSARRAPVLLAVDDLHWMDHPSIDALGFVARRISNERVILLCTSRPHPLPFSDHGTLEWLELGAIDAAASAALLEAWTPQLSWAARRRVLRQARGNPLALREFATALASGQHGWSEFADAIPMTTRLEQTFAARVEDLDPAARAILSIAAIDDGEDINDVLAAAEILHGSSLGPATAQPAFDHGLLVANGETYRIAHPLIGSALRQSAPLVARQEAHAALAQVLGDHPDRATWHRASSASRRDEHIAAELERAAGRARHRGAVASAAAWLERAAALSPDPASQASRLLSAAEISFQLGRFNHVERIKAQVAGMSLRSRDRSRLLWLEGVFHDGSTGEPAEVQRLVDMAANAVTSRDSDLAMQLLVGAARRVWWRDPGKDLRREIVLTAEDVGVAANDPRLLAIYALSESHEHGQTVFDHLARWPADAGGRPELAGLLGIAAFCTGDFPRALAFLSTPIEALRAHGQLSLLAEALSIRAWAEIYLGIFDVARSADEAVRLADETGQATWAATARIAVAFDRAVGGGGEADEELLSKAQLVALRMPNASSSLLAGIQLARGVAELGANRNEQAYGELCRVFDPADPAFQRVQQVWTLSYLVDAAVRTGHEAEARAILTSMEGLAATSPSAGATISLEYSRAVLAEDETAESLFLSALHGAGRELPWHRARVELAYGSWLRRRHRVVESRGPLRAARGNFDAVGARAWAERADQELRATGERGWRPSSAPRELLSPQETQIAELAAQGLSNREIGQRLFLSHRTVGSHLYRIFPKIGVTSRSQLGAALTATGSPPQV